MLVCSLGLPHSLIWTWFRFMFHLSFEAQLKWLDSQKLCGSPAALHPTITALGRSWPCSIHGLHWLARHDIYIYIYVPLFSSIPQGILSRFGLGIIWIYKDLYDLYFRFWKWCFSQNKLLFFLFVMPDRYMFGQIHQLVCFCFKSYQMKKDEWILWSNIWNQTK